MVMFVIDSQPTITLSKSYVRTIEKTFLMKFIRTDVLAFLRLSLPMKEDEDEVFMILTRYYL